LERLEDRRVMAAAELVIVAPGATLIHRDSMRTRQVSPRNGRRLYNLADIFAQRAVIDRARTRAESLFGLPPIDWLKTFN
jgi:hypothetical protein